MTVQFSKNAPHGSIILRIILQTIFRVIIYNNMGKYTSIILILGSLAMAACSSVQKPIKKNASRVLIEGAHSTTRYPEKVMPASGFHGETLFFVSGESFRQMGTTYYLEAPRTRRSVSTLPSFNDGVATASSPNWLLRVCGEPNSVSADGRSWKYWVSGKP